MALAGYAYAGALAVESDFALRTPSATADGSDSVDSTSSEQLLESFLFFLLTRRAIFVV
jgi:hypothetical protein